MAGSEYYDWGDWRGTWELDGGGALMNQGVHTVDLLWLAWGGRWRCSPTPPSCAPADQDEDVASGWSSSEYGALGVLHCTTGAFPGLRARLQVHGAQGSAVIDNDELTFIHVTPEGRDKPEENPHGSPPKDDALNQLDEYLPVPSAACPSTAGSDPGQLSDAHRAPVRELPGRAARRAARSGSAWPRTASRSASSSACTSRPAPAAR